MAPPYTEGIMPAIITPMNADGSVNYDAFRAVLEDNIQRGVHGFWIAGGTGESVYLTEEENMALADISVEVCKGRATTIHHVGVSTQYHWSPLAVLCTTSVAIPLHSARAGQYH